MKPRFPLRTFVRVALPCAVGALLAAVSGDHVKGDPDLVNQPGRLSGTASVANAGGTGPAAAGAHPTGAPLTVTAALTAPAGGYSGSATATARGGADPMVGVSFRGAGGFGSGAPVTYSGTAAASYAFELQSDQSEMASLLYSGSITASGDYAYPAELSISSSATGGASNNLLADNFNPALTHVVGPLGGDYSYPGGGAGSPTNPETFTLVIPVETNTVYTVNLSASLFDDLGPAVESVSLDPVFSVPPSFLQSDPGAQVVTSPGFQPPLSAVPEPSTYAGAGVALLALVAWTRRRAAAA